MTETLLIPRDQTLELGRKLRFTFTVSYEVTLDENVLQDEQAATVEQVEDWLGPDETALWRELERNYDRDVIEHTVELADVNESLEDSPAPGFPYELRFESQWEREERIRGNAEAVWFRSRTWLDAIPAPNVGASA